MRFMTGLSGISGARLPFRRPGLGQTRIPEAARARIDHASFRKDEGFRKVEGSRGLALAIGRNRENLALLLGSDKAREAAAQAEAAVARAWAAYEEAAVELENARVAAGLTRLEV